MGDITLGEIRLFPYATVVPDGWLPCEGQLLNIKQYAALNALLGAYYGGDGKTTFALPDLRGRTPVGLTNTGQAMPGRIPVIANPPGQKGGSEAVTLTVAQIPAHTHTFSVEPSNASGNSVIGALPSTSAKPSVAPATAPAAPNLYAAAGTAPATLAPGFIGAAGGGQGHENRQPYLALRYCICVQGLFPQRN